MKKIGIIGAMETEVDYLKKLAEKNGGIKTSQAGSLTFVEGVINGRAVVIVKSGVGKVNAALCAQRLIIQFGVTHVINTGIAGAMAKGLGVLDFVVSADAVYHDMDATQWGYAATVIPQMEVSAFQGDPAMIQAAQATFDENKDKTPFSGHKLLAGRIASGDQFIAEAGRKQHILDTCNPSCVEMEGAAIAHACYLCHTPFIVLRCMSDMADDDGKSTYEFSENTAAEMSAKLVEGILKRL